MQTGISLSQLYGVASFYNQFRLVAGRASFIVTVCHGTACHVAGAPLITDAFSEELGIEVGKTTKDRLFTLQTVSCVGACALAPVVRVGDDETHGRMTPDKARELVNDLRAGRGRPMSVVTDDGRAMCRRPSRRLRGRRVVAHEGARRGAHLRRHRLPRLGPSGRHRGLPRRARRAGPDRDGARRRDRLPRLLRAGSDRRRAARRVVLPARPCRTTSPTSSRRASSTTAIDEKLLYKDPETGEPIAHETDIPFYSGQRRLVLALNGKVDPYSIDDYLAHGGYTALAKVLADDDPEDVIEAVTESGLRGRGGAGFPTGTKWRLTPRRAPASSSTSSATPTRATPARSWTARCSRATRTS